MNELMLPYADMLLFNYLCADHSCVFVFVEIDQLTLCVVPSHHACKHVVYGSDSRPT